MSSRMGSARTAPVPPPDDVIKILISTDNHLGYLEKDPVRGDDSFRVFEEVLELAKSNNVDMLLLGGDLFHDNKPSRSTVVKTMRLLRHHCLSPDGEVRLAVRSDPALVNYMDPCVAVSLPVFVIHGNHDDPTGGAGLDALSSLDLLSHAGLITYFGRAVSSKKVEVAPILLQKGQTALALYGLGNVRDEVLYDTWARHKRVKWLSPEQPARRQAERHLNVDGSEEDEEDDDDGDDIAWFNLFVLHQNRLTRGSSKGISDTLLPTWLDYVVWGHEHDSLPDLTLSKPPIVQPGSTVATSLSIGESKPKHAILLEVYKGKLKHRSVPLYTVRNFHFDDIALSTQSGLSETDPEGLNKFLEDTINEMVEKQETLFDNKMATFQGGTSKEVVNGVRYPPRSFYVDKLTSVVRQPLIRLRVEVTGNWESPNPQRFGQAYVGRVACASDMLLFYRSKRRLKKSRTFLEGNAMRPDGEEEEEEDGTVSFSQTDADGQDVVHIPKLVQYFLYHRQVGGSGLKFLELDKLTGAVDQFVNKLENRAIPDYVQAYLKVQQDKTLNEATQGGKALDEGELLEKFKTEATAAANRILAESQPQPSQRVEGAKAVKAMKQDGEKSGENVDGKMGEEPKTTELRTDTIQQRLDDVHAVLSNHPKLAAALEKTGPLASDDEEDDIEAVPVKRNARSSGRGRSRARGRGRSTPTSRRTTTARKPVRPPARESSARRASRAVDSFVIEDSDEEKVQAAPDRIVLEDSEEEYVPVATTRKRRARNNASGSRSSSRARLEPTPTSQPRRSAFANRARARRSTATIDLDEESGDDAM